MKVHSDTRKKELKAFNESVQKMIVAVGEADFDSQIVEMTKAIEHLQNAKMATLNLHGGISN